MTKADIVDRIALSTGISKTETAAIVNGFLTCIVEALKQNKHIEIRGFGTFKVVKRASRVARNIKTGQQIRLPERYLPVFKPSKQLRSLVEEQQT
ncbi:MAG: integration host factor subunit beta [Candidatus Latescibacteria bacterium]|nr:integration host factor subunit beta [Candidatus Latescibacterota bacterium]